MSTGNPFYVRGHLLPRHTPAKAPLLCHRLLFFSFKLTGVKLRISPRCSQNSWKTSLPDTMDEASEIVMRNTPHSCEGHKTRCWSHKHLTRHKHHTSIHRKGHKDTKISFQQVIGYSQNQCLGGYSASDKGKLFCFWSSWQTAEQTLWAAQSTNTAEWNHPFGKCQSLWLTSYCNKHGKDSVSLSGYSSYILQKEQMRTVYPLQTSQSHGQEFSHPVNKTRAKPPKHDPPSASCIIHLGRLKWGWKFPSHGKRLLGVLAPITASD